MTDETQPEQGQAPAPVFAALGELLRRYPWALAVLVVLAGAVGAWAPHTVPAEYSATGHVLLVPAAATAHNPWAGSGVLALGSTVVATPDPAASGGDRSVVLSLSMVAPPAAMVEVRATTRVSAEAAARAVVRVREWLLAQVLRLQAEASVTAADLVRAQLPDEVASHLDTTGGQRQLAGVVSAVGVLVVGVLGVAGLDRLRGRWRGLPRQRTRRRRGGGFAAGGVVRQRTGAADAPTEFLPRV